MFCPPGNSRREACEVPLEGIQEEDRRKSKHQSDAETSLRHRDVSRATEIVPPRLGSHDFARPRQRRNETCSAQEGSRGRYLLSGDLLLPAALAGERKFRTHLVMSLQKNNTDHMRLFGNILTCKLHLANKSRKEGQVPVSEVPEIGRRLVPPCSAPGSRGGHLGAADKAGLERGTFGPLRHVSRPKL